MQLLIAPFIVNGEEIEVTQDYGTEIELPEEPTKEGYNFNGWKLVDTEDDEIVMMPTTIPAGDIKVEPYWTIGQYTINYIDTDGTSIYFETLDFDSEIKAPEDPEKTGYTFLGWYSGNATYNFSSKVINDITLTAKWKQIKTPAKEEPKEESKEEITGKVEEENKVTE